MTIILDFILVIWTGRLLLNILSYTHLWFVKEYRWDRMLIHLKTKQGKMFLFPAYRRPPFSPKSITLSFFLLMVISLFIILSPFNIFLRFALADLLMFPLSFLLVGILTIPTFIYHRIKITKAQSKLFKHKAMTVIGITGSYGKTSTKEYLATILETKYQVLKTEASKNSAIGIAEVILPKLTYNHEVFIVEMGAYRRGEIRGMTEMVKPEIGIITAINPQHQDLFGTIETTMKAKYELIVGLKGKKIAIFNADNELVRQMADWAKDGRVSVWSVGCEAEKISNANEIFIIKNIKGDLKGISFELLYGKDKIPVKAPVLGEHQATNISLAIAAAVAGGMSLKEAATSASGLKPFAKTMEPSTGINGSLFINDTFNNNPDAAIAALKFLAETPGRKFLVFQPMIELGSFAQKSHELVGERAAEVCDEIILTNSNFFEYFKSGVTRSGKKGVEIKVMSTGKASAYIRKTVAKGDTVLFKGKEAENVLKQLT